MPAGLRERLTYGNVVATIALFAVLGGTGVASTVADTAVKLGGGVAGKAVNLESGVEKALKRSKHAEKKARKAIKIAKRAKKGQGPQGPQGPKGDSGLSEAFASERGSGRLDTLGVAVRVAQVDLPQPGYYVTQATVDVDDQDLTGNATVDCYLRPTPNAGADPLAHADTEDVGTLTLISAFRWAPGAGATLELACSSDALSGVVNLSSGYITATRVDSLNGQSE